MLYGKTNIATLNLSKIRLKACKITPHISVILFRHSKHIYIYILIKIHFNFLLTLLYMKPALNATY